MCLSLSLYTERSAIFPGSISIQIVCNHSFLLCHIHTECCVSFARVCAYSNRFSFRFKNEKRNKKMLLLTTNSVYSSDLSFACIWFDRFAVYTHCCMKNWCKCFCIECLLCYFSSFATLYTKILLNIFFSLFPAIYILNHSVYSGTISLALISPVYFHIFCLQFKT